MKPECSRSREEHKERIIRKKKLLSWVGRAWAGGARLGWRVFPEGTRISGSRCRKKDHIWELLRHREIDALSLRGRRGRLVEQKGPVQYVRSFSLISNHWEWSRISKLCWCMQSTDRTVCPATSPMTSYTVHQEESWKEILGLEYLRCGAFPMLAGFLLILKATLVFHSVEESEAQRCTCSHVLLQNHHDRLYMFSIHLSCHPIITDLSILGLAL